MKFGSVCSGIEAASVAFEPLGWKAAWFSEIEPFPCAVLKHHYPDTPNHGDMTTLPERIRSGEVEAPDLFCGGTPCQAFSVAGLRQSLADDRGNLSLTFCEIANAIDDVRLGRGESPTVIFWENVPGVLSTQDNAFGCFLGALSGCDTPISPGRLGWTDAGVVAGPQRTVSWRVLDAQYFGLAQRRRRVFVVASAREGFDPSEVLLEWQGVRRDFAPSREAGQRPTGSIVARTGRNGGASNQDVNGGMIALCLNAKGGAGRMDAESETLIPTTGGVFDVAHTLRGERFDASEDGTGRGTPLVPVSIEIGPSGAREVDVNPTLDTRAKDGPIRNQLAGAVLQPVTYADVAPTLTSNGDAHTGYRDEHGLVPVAFHPTQDPISSHDVCHAIGANENATAAVAFGFDGDVMKDGLMETMTTREGAISDTAHAVMQPIAWDEELNASVDQAGTLLRGGQGGRHDGVAVAMRESGQGYWVQDEIAGTIDANMGMSGHANRPAVIKQMAMQVRRLTPVECERLQGFPDGYTAIPWRGKPTEECPDGPRYKALGNSWAVPCVRWIGRRIQQEVQGKVPS